MALYDDTGALLLSEKDWIAKIETGRCALLLETQMYLWHRALHGLRVPISVMIWQFD